MILGYETIIAKVIQDTGLPRKEIEEKVEQKLKELQGLISKEGAAHIVANSLNVKLFDATSKNLKVNNLQSGLNSVNVTVRILNIYEIRNFSKNNQERRVANILVGDETGTTKVVIWDENLINEVPKLKEGDILKVLNAQARENNGNIELHLGNKSQLKINPENESVGEIKITATSKKKFIKDIKENEFVEICGHLVQIFEPRYYNACPVCNKKTLEQNGHFSCMEHNIITPNKVPIVNIILDDSTDNVRIVLFRDIAEKLIGKNQDFQIVQKNVLGKSLTVKGKVNKNEMFQRVELMANSIEETNPEDILKGLE